MRDPIRVDPRAAIATFRERSHGDDLGPLQVAPNSPSGLEGQRNETVGSALRAWPHGSLILSP